MASNMRSPYEFLDANPFNKEKLDELIEILKKRQDGTDKREEFMRQYKELRLKVKTLMEEVAVLNIEENKFNRFEIMDLE